MNCWHNYENHGQKQKKGRFKSTAASRVGKRRTAARPGYTNKNPVSARPEGGGRWSNKNPCWWFIFKSNLFLLYMFMQARRPVILVFPQIIKFITLSQTLNPTK